MSELSNWRSPDGVRNAHAVQANFAEGFHAMSEFDRIGHLLLHRAGQREAIVGLEQVVGVALLRRVVTVFSAVRTLLESSHADPTRALARAYFELWLNYRCLAYGALSEISLETPTEAAQREPRARRFHVASERRGLRSRAMMLLPGSHYAPKTLEERDSLEKELVEELYRLRETFSIEWEYFGDSSPDALSVIDTRRSALVCRRMGSLGHLNRAGGDGIRLPLGVRLFV